MRSISISRGVRNLGAGIVGLTLLLPATARAHVAFDAPLAGDTLVAGETVSVAWTDLVLHDPESFDLDLLLSEDGEAIPIAHGLSIDTHSYEWTVPDQPCTGCLLRVIQFNTFNYDYWEAIPITITSSGTSGGSGGSAGKGGSAGEASGGTSAASDGGTAGVESGGAGGASANDGGTTNTGGSDTTGGTAGSSGANGGSGAGAATAGAPAAGAPAAGAGASGDTDEASADEGCSSSPRAPAPASPWLVTAVFVGVAASLRAFAPGRRVRLTPPRAGQLQAWSGGFTPFR